MEQLLNNIEMKQETAPPIEVPEKEEENDLSLELEPDLEEMFLSKRKESIQSSLLEQFPFRHSTGHQIHFDPDFGPYFKKEKGKKCAISNEYENGTLRDEYVRSTFVKCLKKLSKRKESDLDKMKKDEDYQGMNFSFLVEYEMVAHIAIGIKSLQIRNNLIDYQYSEEIKENQFPFDKIQDFMKIFVTKGNIQPMYPEDAAKDKEIGKLLLQMIQNPKQNKIDEIIMRCKKRIEDIKEVELSSYRNLQLQDFSIYKEFGGITFEQMTQKINQYKDGLKYFKDLEINKEFTEELSNVIDTLNARVTKASKIVKAMELRLKNLRISTFQQQEEDMIINQEIKIQKSKIKMDSLISSNISKNESEMGISKICDAQQIELKNNMYNNQEKLEITKMIQEQSSHELDDTIFNNLPEINEEEFQQAKDL